MQQPKNSDPVLESFLSSDKGKALETLLKSFQDEFNEQNPRYAAAADKDSFRAGFADGVECASLGMLAVVLDLVTSEQEAGECFIQILDMLETLHYTGHVLHGGQPRCRAVERLLEEAALKSEAAHRLHSILETLRAAVNATPGEPPTTIN